MAHGVAPRRPLCRTSTLPGNVQFLVPNSLWKFFPCVTSKVTYGLLAVWCLDGLFYVSFFIIFCLMFGVLSEGSFAYACIISSPESLHACFVVFYTKDQAPGV